jgi:cell division protein FtsB
MDPIHDFAKWVERNRWLAMGILLAVIFAGGIVGCQMKTDSILVKGERVNATQLEREVIQGSAGLQQRRTELEAQIAKLNSDIEAFNSTAEAAYGDLEHKQELYAQAIGILGGGIKAVVNLAAGQPVDAVEQGGAAVTGGMALLLGMGYMNSKRKDTVIANLKSSSTSTAA